MVVDLWAEDIGHVDVKPPVAILREQASLLGAKTQNLVAAQVRQYEGSKPGRFVYRFNVIAPGLGGYSYALFSIAHGIELYPVEFWVDEVIANEVGIPMDSDSWEAESEEHFMDLLGTILRAPKTSRLVNSLLAQSDSEAAEEQIPF